MKKWDGFDEAVIGMSSLWIEGERVDVLVYDSKLMIKQLVNRDGMSGDEAVEYIYFNIEGAYIGKDTPVVVWEYYDE